MGQKCVVDKQTFDMVPEGGGNSAGKATTMTLTTGGWDGTSQVKILPVEYFQLTTIIIPPDKMSVWAEHGIYAEISYDDGGLLFQCDTAPSENLQFTAVQTPLSEINSFTGNGGTVTGWNLTYNQMPVPYGVTGIADGAFADRNFTKVVVAKTATTIGSRAFAGCTAMTAFEPNELPDNYVAVDSIGAYAFDGCTALAEIWLNCNTGATIADYAFNGCTGLETITLGGDYTGTKLVFNGCVNVTSIVFQDAEWENDADFSFTDNLTATSLGDMIDKLKDYSSGTAHTLTIGVTNKSRLSSAQIAAAEAKNWTVV